MRLGPLRDCQNEADMVGQVWRDPGDVVILLQEVDAIDDDQEGSCFWDTSQQLSKASWVKTRRLKEYQTTSGAYAGFSEGGVPRGGEGVPRVGGGPRSTKEANNPNKHATEIKSRTCAHQGSIFRP